MSKAVLSDWINENVPDDAMWSEVYITARKEETQSGRHVKITQSLREVREVHITGKELKAHLNWEGSPVLGIALLIVSLVMAVLDILLRGPMETSRDALILFLVIAAAMAAGGIYLIIRSRKKGSTVQSIASWEAIDPWIADAFGKKVFDEETEARRQEHGDQGSAHAGYYCIPARLAAQGRFDTAVSSVSTKGNDGIYFNFSPYDDLMQAMKQAALALPKEQCVRRKVR